MAAGLVFNRGDHRHLVVIGKDTRLSGYMIEPALTAGFISMGMDVVLVGPLPTPAIAMLTRSLRADLGVMISASHNPYQDNGIKLFGPDGYKLSDEIEAQIEAAIDRAASQRAPANQLGRAKRLDDAGGRYIEFVKNSFPQGLAPRRPQDRGRLRQWRRLQGRAHRAVGTGRRGRADRRRARRHQHQPRLRHARDPDHAARGRRRNAPISGSRSTATPTGWWCPTRTGDCSTATS